MTTEPRIGFACAYTPLALLDAAGFAPFRIMPLTEAPDQAGTLLHDNMCPHVKRVLDRAMHRDLPELAGLVLMNSCDAMRRLADGWLATRPDDQVLLLDLPAACDDRAVEYFARELARLSESLAEWGGRPVTPEGLVQSTKRYDEMGTGFLHLEDRVARGTFVGGRKALQELHNQSVTVAPVEFIEKIRKIRVQTEIPLGTGLRVPVFLFGNVLPDPEAFALFEACGAQVVADDLCTGSRQLTRHDMGESADVFLELARAIMARPPCARTVPGQYTEPLDRQVITRARESGAKGVIAHIMKFCDPYLARMPMVQQALRDEDLPLLTLEGDCTLRSLGQQRTRIEAFVEMLGGSPS
jgi:benzoyl-CoA reductase/2-hydroxyglutaryl-CoA dehydratase subunit BcrC/BadD/HgdB